MPRPEHATALARRAVFVDSGAWIALLSRDDRYHGEADRLFRHCLAQRRPLITSNLVLAEVQRFVLHHAGIAAARVAVEHIEASRALTLRFGNEGHHRSALEWLRRLPDQDLTYTDATSFAIMRDEGLSLVLTFDRDFVIAGFTPLRLAR